MSMLTESDWIEVVREAMHRRSLQIIQEQSEGVLYDGAVKFLKRNFFLDISPK